MSGAPGGTRPGDEETDGWSGVDEIGMHAIAPYPTERPADTPDNGCGRKPAHEREHRRRGSRREETKDAKGESPAKSRQRESVPNSRPSKTTTMYVPNHLKWRILLAQELKLHYFERENSHRNCKRIFELYGRYLLGTTYDTFLNYLNQLKYEIGICACRPTSKRRSVCSSRCVSPANGCGSGRPTGHGPCSRWLKRRCGFSRSGHTRPSTSGSRLPTG